MSPVLGVSELVGGRKSLLAVAGMLGLDAAPGPGGWRLTRVQSLGEGKVRLSVAGDPGEANVILMPAPAEHYFIRAGKIDICYEGREAAPALLTLLESFAQRLQAATTENILRILESDPDAESGLPGAAAADGERADPDSQGISDRLGGNPGQWRRFFCDREFGRAAFWGGASGFKGKVLYFVHADFDCSFMPPDVTFRGMTFLNYPPVHPHSGETPAMDMQYEHWTSELRDKDVVLGTDRRLDALLDEIRHHLKPDLIMIQWSCAPTIIGDDIELLARRVKEAGDCPVLTNTIEKRLKESGDYSPFEDLFRQLLADPRFAGVPRDPGALNLVDCPAHFYDAELGPILDAAGIRVNQRVFPAVDLQGLRRYLAADFQLLPDYFRGIPTVERSLGSLPLDSVFVPAPFGLRGACEYVRVIGERFGKARQLLQLHMDHWEKRRARWDALVAEAGTRQLTFVCDEGSLPQMLRRNFLTGIPVVDMVAEMGFDAEFLVYAPNGTLPADAARLEKLSGFQRPPTVRGFSDAAALDRALGDSRSGAVYSDIFFDPRITGAGKAQFSMRTCEAGIDGAIRTLDRLLGMCRLPFYGKYQRHLRKARS